MNSNLCNILIGRYILERIKRYKNVNTRKIILFYIVNSQSLSLPLYTLCFLFSECKNVYFISLLLLHFYLFLSIGFFFLGLKLIVKFMSDGDYSSSSMFIKLFDLINKFNLFSCYILIDCTLFNCAVYGGISLSGDNSSFSY